MLTREMSSSNRYISEWRQQKLSESYAFPSLVYTSEEFYQREREKLFGKAWYYVGHMSQLSGHSSYFTVNIAEHPLVIISNDKGQLRGYYNVCPHRASPLAQGSGTCRFISCPYHAWTFDLDGNLKSAPEMSGATDFDRQDYSLTPIKVESWDSLIWVNLDPDCAPLAQQLGELPQMFSRYRMGELAKIAEYDYWVEANWKLYVENGIENYHEPIVHPTFAKYYDNITVNVGSYYSNQYAPGKQGVGMQLDDQSFNDPEMYIKGLNEEEMTSNYICAMFPNVTIVFCPNLLVINLVDPQGVARTRLNSVWLAPDTDAAKDPDLIDSMFAERDQVMIEDLNLLPEIQKRHFTGRYKPGRLSPKREPGIHFFQDRVMRFLQA